MAMVKQSTLPTVLKEYMPEYEPGFTTHASDRKTLRQKSDYSGQSRSRTSGHKLTPLSKSGGRQGGKPLRSGSPVSGKYRRRNADNERFENVSVSWEIAKSELRQERHQQLQEKLQLQHHLLRLQDELTKYHRSRDEQNRQQLKESERSKKQVKNAALQEICKRSLAEDRKAAVSQRKSKKEPSEKEDVSDGDTQRSTSSVPSTPDQKTRSRPRHHVSRSPTLPKSPMRELEVEEDEDEDLNLSATSSDLESLPWHHQQLYRLYGSDADYFIHPKIEPKVNVPVSPKLKKTTGHVGAEKLWTLLRGESNSKLLREDGRFPHDLKDAYSAFVRESLTLGRRPVIRNYTATDDVPDMKKLLDQSLLRNIRRYRHKTGIMYRASRANNDRTNILLFNNPLPDITEGDVDTISRYMPSWMDSMSDTTDPGYRKWLTAGERASDTDTTTKPGDLGTKVEEPEGTTLAIEDAPDVQAPKQSGRQKSKLLFLTEKESKVPGEFAERFYQQRQKKDLPKAHSHLPSVKPQSSLGFMESSPSQYEKESPQGPVRSVSMTSKQDLLRRFTSDWQPLSMAALIEYKQQVDTEGNGEFQHGRMRMWPVVTSTTA